MQGKLRSKCFMAVLALGVRRRCIYVALAGKPGCQVGPGPGWPRDTTNLPQQPSWIPFLLTLFLFPPHSISLSCLLNFSFLLTLVLFPPYFIYLSSLLYFSFLLFLVLFPPRFVSLSFSHYFFPPRFFLPWPWPSFWFCVDGWRGNNWQGRVRKVKIAVEDNGWAKNKQWSAALNFVFALSVFCICLLRLLAQAHALLSKAWPCSVQDMKASQLRIV